MQKSDKLDQLNKRQKSWLKALKSGNYAQTQEGALWTKEDDKDRGYCCLGVACLMFDSEWEGFQGKEVVPLDALYKTQSKSEYPREELWRDVLHLNSSAGRFLIPAKPEDENEEDYVECLANLNDEGMSFSQIAAFIESNPEHIFTNVV